MKQENKIKLIMLSTIFIIMTILIIIVYNNLNFTKEEEPPKEEEIITPYNMELESEYSIFFANLNTLNQFLMYQSEQNIKALMNTLSKEYINQNKINENNILEKLEKYDIGASIQIKSMYYQEYNENFLYYITGDILLTEYEETMLLKENVRYLLFVDYQSMSYEVYPLKEEDTKNLPFTIQNIAIENQEYNHMQTSNYVNNNYLCNLYLSDFYNRLVKNTKETYSLLEDNYKFENFPSEMDYLEFWQDKKDKISLEITSCNLKMVENKRVYTIQDINKNTFTIEEESIMNYRIKLSLKENN